MLLLLGECLARVFESSSCSRHFAKSNKVVKTISHLLGAVTNLLIRMGLQLIYSSGKRSTQLIVKQSHVDEL